MTCRSPLIHVEVDSSLWLLLNQVSLLQQEGFTKNNLMLSQSIPWTSPNLDFTRSTLYRSGKVSQNLFTRTSTASSQSSWRARCNHASKPSRRRQPPKVTSWRCFLGEPLVPQAQKQLKSSTRRSHPHKRSTMCVRREGELKYVKYGLQMAKRVTKDPRDEYLYSPPKILAVGERISNSASLAVRPQKTGG